jgi:hypothetical protein
MLSNLQKLSNVAKALESERVSLIDFTEQASGSSSLSLSGQEHVLLFGEFLEDLRKGHLSETEARSILHRARAIVVEEQVLVLSACAADSKYAQVGQLWVGNCDRLLGAYDVLLSSFDSASETLLDRVLSDVRSVFEEKSLLLERLPPALRTAPEPEPPADVSAEGLGSGGVKLATFFSAEPSQTYESFLSAIMAALDEPSQDSLEALCYHFGQVLGWDQARLQEQLQQDLDRGDGERAWTEQTAELQEILQDLACCGDSEEREEIFEELEALTEERISLHLELWGKTFL